MTCIACEGYKIGANMSNYQSSRSTRTYQYTNTGPGGQGTRVTETRIVGGPGGTKTETKTYYSGAPADGSIGFSSGFGPGAGGGGSSFPHHGNLGCITRKGP